MIKNNIHKYLSVGLTSGTVYVDHNVYLKYYIYTFFVLYKYNMNITSQQMLALDAVINQGSVQGGAKHLNKTHPSVITTLKNLEAVLGFELFDRTGYRSVLTDKGRAFHKHVKRILGDIVKLENQVKHLRDNEEAELNVVIGDITPLPVVMKVLRTFAQDNPNTRLNLFFGNLYGPNELLFDGKADLIIHHIDISDPRYEYREFCKVVIVPVVAAEFLNFSVSKKIRYEELRDYPQCLIRDTSTHTKTPNRFVVDNAPHITVGDQYTKKEVILQGMGWGHMPLFLIEKDLKQGKLISIEGSYIKSIKRDIVIARLSEKTNGMVAERLWQSFG
jgi:DNA-binding transcriptional LysR family regulator